MGKKIQVEANELKNGNIEKISLVTHGAIRQPFKILKMEQIPHDEGTMREKIGKLFGGTSGDQAAVAALYVRKDVARKWLPLIKGNGFRAEKEHAELDGDVLVLKQESYDPEAEGSLIALTPDVAIQLDRVVKGFDPFPMSANFDDNVRASSFFPGLHNALESLAETVWNVLNQSESPEDASSEVAKQVKAFGSHLNNLVAELPTAVFKMEQESLTKEFEGSNVSTSQPETTVTKDEETDMTKPVLKEAAPGDLDGLLDDAPAADAALAKAEEGAEDKVEKTTDDKADDVEKSGDAGAPKTGGSPGSEVVGDSAQTDTGAVSLDEGGVPAGMRKEERVVKEIEDGKIVEKKAIFFVNDETKEEIFGGFVEKAADDEPAADPAAATAQADGVDYSPAELKLFEALGVLVKEVTGIKKTVEEQNERIEAVAKTADKAKETAEETVVLNVADDLDESLATLQGHQTVHQVTKRDGETVEKSENDIFKGLLPQIEGNAA